MVHSQGSGRQGAEVERQPQVRPDEASGGAVAADGQVQALAGGEEQHRQVGQEHPAERGRLDAAQQDHSFIVFNPVYALRSLVTSAATAAAAPRGNAVEVLHHAAVLHVVYVAGPEHEVGLFPRLVEA